jgi:hypothetical protein
LSNNQEADKARNLDQQSQLITKHHNMANDFRQRLSAAPADLKSKTKPSGWVLPRAESSFADEGSW